MVYTLKPRVKEPVSCYITIGALHDTGASVHGNLCQGSKIHGFILPHIPCGYVNNPPYRNNTAGSIEEVAFIFSKTTAGCVLMTEVRAYASNIGQICSPAAISMLKVTNFIIADCGRAVSLRYGGAGIDRPAYFEDSFITAISRPDCPDCYGSGAIDCSGNYAVRMLTITVNG